MRFASRAVLTRLGAHATLAVVIIAMGEAAAPDAQAGNMLYVICNPAVHVTQEDLRDVFLGEKQFAGSVRLIPADNRAAQAAFLERILKMAFSKYSTAWTKKSFRDGVNPPPVKGSDAEAIEFVRRETGACSYVTTAPPSGVQVIMNSAT